MIHNSQPLRSLAVRIYGEPTTSPEGFLFVPVVFMKKRVMNYVLPDGSTQRELPDFSMDDTYLLAQVDGLSFVLYHPGEQDEGGEFYPVTPDNYAELIKGVLTAPRFELDADGAPVILALLKVWDPVVMEMIRNKDLSEVSQGYWARMVEKPGEYNGERYDVLQTDFVFNHLALVESGRNGEDVRVLYNRTQLKLNRGGSMNGNGKQSRSRRNGEGSANPNDNGEEEFQNRDNGEGFPNPDDKGDRGEDELQNQDDYEPRLTALEQKIDKVFELLSRVVPEGGGEKGGGGEMTGNSLEASLSVFNAAEQVSAGVKEWQDTYLRAKLILNTDTDTEMARHSTMDSLRRHCLTVNKSVPPERVKRMNSTEVKSYFEALTDMLFQDMNAPRSNAGDDYVNAEGDTMAYLADIRR